MELMTKQAELVLKTGKTILYTIVGLVGLLIVAVLLGPFNFIQ
jgi:hypothetical protein